MAENWTEEQRQAIQNRNRNLLVSAAAGSGKTAVLTARILAMVMDPVHPVDIDRILVVTFTRAAAAEMRDRIRKAIRDQAEAEPQNAQLRRQLSLMGHAQITTIDSFLNYVVRSNYDKIDIDPAFRTADEGEIRLLKSDVFRQLLEERYAENDPVFIRFAETVSAGKTDEAIEDLVLRIFTVTESMADPERWFQTVLQNYRVTEPAALEASPWYSWYLSYLRTIIKDLAEQMDRIAEDSAEAVPGFVPMLLKERDMILNASKFESGAELPKLLSDIRFDTVRAKAVGTESKDPELDRLKKERDLVKNGIKALLSELIPAEEQLKILGEVLPSIETLVQLVRDFSERFREEKKHRMIADFTDIARMALRILRGPDGAPTDTARQFAAYYEEIMIDEYQDSNEIQEAILTAVSREQLGQPDVFMVGDVKQSIYRFRMARPELFNQKYNTYSTEDSLYQKVELHMNFRSRPSVLACVNAFFYQLMQESAGGIRYDDACALYPCDTIFPDYTVQEGETPREPFLEEPELLVLDLEPEAGGREQESAPSEAGGREQGAVPSEAGGTERDGTPENETGDPGTEEATESSETDDFDLTGTEWEARLVAEKIHALMDPAKGRTIYDNDLRRYRPLRYGDIAILLRTGTEWADTFLEVLTSEGIPANTEGSRGYYSSREVQLVLDLLTVIDNPLSDIPLAAVMHSPLFGFTSEELAVIRNGYDPRSQGLGFYGAVKEYLERGGGRLQEKTAAFFERLGAFRRASHELPLSEFLRRIYRETGLLYQMAAMPGGARRRANLEMLITKAHDFEQTSYHGVFQFIRYIEKLKSYELDTGEASAMGENENVVRIMTIHKSKGLEYPVIFLSGLGKRFNRTDERAGVIIHQDLGIGADNVDPEARTKQPNPLKKALALKLAEEACGEELRVLYVAMTRAREKLYLTGTVKKKEMEKYRRLLEKNAEKEAAPLCYTDLVKAPSMLDWLLKAYRPEMPVQLVFTDILTLAAGAALRETEDGRAQTFRDVLDRLPREEADLGRLRAVFTADYLYDDLYRTDATVSVSRLKQEHMQAMLTETEEARDLLEIRGQRAEGTGDDQSTGTSGSGDEKSTSTNGSGDHQSTGTNGSGEHQQKDTEGGEGTKITGAERGTLYHSVLEWLDPHVPVEAQLSQWEKEGLISTPEKDTINPNIIRGFLFSPLGTRYVKALEAGRAYREKQFIIGVPVKEIWKDLKVRPEEQEALVMIQGIIDLYFEEEDGIILVDYKTDRVYEEQVLREKYREQLLLYRRALQMFTHLPVREMWIYSLTMGKAILITDT